MFPILYCRPPMTKGLSLDPSLGPSPTLSHPLRAGQREEGTGFSEREVLLAASRPESETKALALPLQAGDRSLCGRRFGGTICFLLACLEGAGCAGHRPGDGGQGCGSVLGPKMKRGDLEGSTPSPLGPATPPGTLTPSDEEEEPLAQALGGVGHDDGCVQVAALHEHPEEVCHQEVVEDCGDAAAPDLHGQGRSGLQPARVCGRGAGGGPVILVVHGPGTEHPPIPHWWTSLRHFSLCFRLNAPSPARVCLTSPRFLIPPFNQERGAGSKRPAG